MSDETVEQYRARGGKTTVASPAWGESDRARLKKEVAAHNIKRMQMRSHGEIIVPELTVTQMGVLHDMRLAELKDNREDAEVVEERRVCYVGDRRISYSTVLALLRHMVIKDVSDTNGMQRYVLNETGRALVNMALGDKMPDCDCDHNETCDICNPPYQEPIFFGCRNEDKGHYAWGPGFSRTHAPSPMDMGMLDFLGHLVDHLKQGEAQLINIGTRFTVLGWKDYSVDDRPGSHCEFLFTGHQTYDYCLDAAKKHFPEVFARFKYPITRQGA